MDKEFFRQSVVNLIEKLSNENSYRVKKMPRYHVYRISKIGRLVDVNGNPGDGWTIANALFKILNESYFKGIEISLNDYFQMLPISVYSKYIEISYM